MFDNVNWALTIALFLVWLIFLVFFPTNIVNFVLSCIAGWQVGNWIYELGTK